MSYTIPMNLSADLSMHFVKAFTGCFSHVDIFS